MSNGGIIGKINLANSIIVPGMWNIREQYFARKNNLWPNTSETVFVDTFETFTGWVTVNSGAISQSSAQVYQGSFSAIKTTADDPNGAYKLLNSTVDRNYLLEAWIFSVEPRIGGGADRISIVNSSGNGYGFNASPSAFSLDVRTSYSSTTVSGSTWTKPSNAWYRVLFRAFPNNTFGISMFDAAGAQLVEHTFSSIDTTHLGPFDRVAILGGRNYHVDNLIVQRIFTAD